MAMCNRWYYKCRDCLTVSATEVELKAEWKRDHWETALCGLCGGQVDCMGKVGRSGRLSTTETLCACDDRCTHATGPHCDCQCGGENHGTKRVVTVNRDLGPVPVLMVPDSDKARTIAAEWREARDDVRRMRNAIQSRRERGEFVPRPEFDRMRELGYALGKAGAAKSHAGRMKILAKYRPEFAA
jgi:hypothetical protein